ncbi:hypothetical protein Cgig2_028607 [Carnegiea gigantea]|uniref:Uncharacterized protein n=1 Tax=Carnegiea gigantea TaxID=171969 RepID=A0A9Q1QDG3_9CARY|nr:hypothetical protein Cgig2_028607 [Carnegiea gigantea]
MGAIGWELAWLLAGLAATTSTITMAPKKRLKAEHLTANHIFPQADSQNGVLAGELFLLWAALNRKTINANAFIANHVDEHAKSAKVVIGENGIITALARALGYSTQLWLNYHGHALFALPNQAKTTITHPSNHVYNDDGDGESRGKSEGSDEDGSDDDVEEVPRGQNGKRQAPVDPSAGTSGVAAATSSGAMGPSMF